jgi:hypothetical protein
MGIQIPTSEILRSGEDVIKEEGMKTSSQYAGYVEAGESDGDAAALPQSIADASRKKLSLDDSLQYAAMVFASRK